VDVYSALSPPKWRFGPEFLSIRLTLLCSCLRSVMHAKRRQQSCQRDKFCKLQILSLHLINTKLILLFIQWVLFSKIQPAMRISQCNVFILTSDNPGNEQHSIGRLTFRERLREKGRKERQSEEIRAKSRIPSGGERNSSNSLPGDVCSLSSYIFHRSYV
jgi:hypothetical protein